MIGKGKFSVMRRGAEWSAIYAEGEVSGGSPDIVVGEIRTHTKGGVGGRTGGLKTLVSVKLYVDI